MYVLVLPVSCNQCLEMYLKLQMYVTDKLVYDTRHCTHEDDDDDVLFYGLGRS